MDTPLITSDMALAERQAKIDHVLNVLLRPVFGKLNIAAEEWQTAVIEDGGIFQDQVVEVVKKLVKKARGIITPVSAQDTGLVPTHWKVRNDKPEGDVDLAKLDYSACPVRENEDYVSGATMMKRARELGAIGSLGFAAELLKAQDEGKEIFPVESRGKHYFIMPLTELQDDVGNGGVACFGWDGSRWALRFGFLGSRFSRRVRFVRRSE